MKGSELAHTLQLAVLDEISRLKALGSEELLALGHDGTRTDIAVDGEEVPNQLLV